MFDRSTLRSIFILGAATALAVFAAACDETASDGLTGVGETGTDDQARRGGPPAAGPTTGSPPSAARTFVASLAPLNAEESFRPVRGHVQVRVRSGQMTVSVRAEGLEPGIPHPQHIHGKLGVGSCPDAGDDANGDGVVDVVEGLPDYGGILVTLDSDLTDGAGTQVDGLPVANEGGTIRYRQSAPLSAVRAGAERELDLGRRHVVLHGVDPETALPEAASIGGLPAWLTLPVACGELEAVGARGRRGGGGR